MSGEYHSEKHPPSRRALAKRKKLVQRRKANLREGAFGKINWECYEHRQLWDMIKSAEPRKLDEQTRRWNRLAENVDAETAAVRTSVQKLLLSWRGPSAAQAAESVHRLTTWASEAARTSWQIGEGLEAYTAAIVEAGRKMPEPVHYYAERWFRDGYAVKALDGPNGAYMLDDLLDDKLPSKQEADRAKAEAVRVMSQYEEASHGVRHQLPRGFETAPKAADLPNHPVPLPLPVTPPAGPPPRDRPRAEPLPSRPTSPVVPPPVVHGPETVNPIEEDTFAASAGVGDLPGGGPTGAAGPGQGAGYGPGTALPGLSAEDAAKHGRGLVGGAGSGFGGTGPVGGSGQGTTAARAGAGGAGFGMYPPMTGTQREEDTEHRDRYGSGYDLLDDLPPAYPPVFGE
ncbi:MAG TPA: PPE domain-containing protein [Amycolatopsis sp.]|nr:PPE domain-containing protein [Amycolatopsis sp.]